MNNYDSSDYLTYKKSKMNPQRAQRVEKRIEKVKRIAKLSFVTFCIMFLCVVVFIKKYAKKVDIEYGRNAMEYIDKSDSDDAFEISLDSGEKHYIDKRLILIQQEENAPSESKVLPQDRDKNEVISLEHYEMLKSSGMEDGETYKTKEPVELQEPQNVNSPAQKTTSDSKKPSLLPKVQTPAETNVNVQGIYEPRPVSQPPSVTKVYSGKYATFDEAKAAQSAVKDSKPNLTPFIRKVGGIYTLQLGSYTNPDVAKNVAGSLRTEGLDTWTHQL